MWKRVGWRRLFWTFEFVLAASIIALFSAQAAQACDETVFRRAALKIAAASYDDGEVLLRSCLDDAAAKYLLGMVPRFRATETSSRESYRELLSEAASLGVPEAASIQAVWLLENNHDRVAAASLLAQAYAASETWGLLMGYVYLTATGNRLSDRDAERVTALADSGFPLAYGVLAVDGLLKTHQAKNQQSQLEQTSALLTYRDVAARGAMGGDPISVLSIIKIDQSFNIPVNDMQNLSDVLSAPEPRKLAREQPEKLKSAYLAWKDIPASMEQPPISKEDPICATSEMVPLRSLCAIRAETDHLICLQPFASYMDPETWVKSAAYRECRNLRLDYKANALFY